MNELEREKIASAAVIIAIYCDDDNVERKKRSSWVKPWLQRRDGHGFYSQLLNELRLEEVHIYKNYLRMTPKNFEEILSLIKDDISKKNTRMREPIPPEIQLAITIRFLATGNTYQDLSMCFRVHQSTIGRFVPKVCQAIYTRLKDKYFKVSLFYYTALKNLTKMVQNTMLYKYHDSRY